MPQAKTTGKLQDFPARLRFFRDQRGVSQAALGEAVGKKPTTVSTWERGETEPSLEDIAKIAAFLRVSPSRLAYGDSVAAEDPAPYVISRENPVGGASSGAARSGEMLNPRHKPVASPTGQDCLDYFTRYVQLAERVPGYIGHTWIELQRHFPIAELERQIDPPPDPPGKPE